MKTENTDNETEDFNSFANWFLTIVLMAGLAIQIVALSGCKKARVPTEWHGIPTNAPAACAWHNGTEMATCIAGGQAYACIRSVRSDLPEEQRGYRIDCAMTTQPCMPEMQATID